MGVWACMPLRYRFAFSFSSQTPALAGVDVYKRQVGVHLFHIRQRAGNKIENKHMEPLDSLPASDLTTTVFLVDFRHFFDFFIYGQRPRRKLVILPKNRNFIVHFALSLYGRISVRCGCGANAPQVDGNSGVLTRISSAVGIDDNGNSALLSLSGQQRKIDIGHNDLLAHTVGDIQAKAIVLERVSDVAVAGDGKGALCAGFGEMCIRDRPCPLLPLQSARTL